VLAVFDSLCPSVHKGLLAGKCPWCGPTIIKGEAVSVPLLYQATTRQQLEKIREWGERMHAVAGIGLALCRMGGPTNVDRSTRFMKRLERLPATMLRDLRQRIEQSASREAAVDLILKALADFEQGENA
jgi:hypothetical protein